MSNVVAGALGAGMTGSYIFSQTIFSMRAGIDNRLMGAIVSAMELLLFLIPFSVVEYMPLLFYGSLLVHPLHLVLASLTCLSDLRAF